MHGGFGFAKAGTPMHGGRGFAAAGPTTLDVLEASAAALAAGEAGGARAGLT